MHDKQFMKETLQDSAKAYQEGRLDRRTFLALCGASGIALTAVMAGDAEAAADHVVEGHKDGKDD